MRKRQIRIHGNSYVIMLTPSDVRDFGLREFDEVDIDELNLLEVDTKKEVKSKNGRNKTRS
jgi:hypothetical protein